MKGVFQSFNVYSGFPLFFLLFLRCSSQFHTFVGRCVFVYLCMHMCVYVNVYVYRRMRACVYVEVYVYMSMCRCACAWMHGCSCVDVHVCTCKYVPDYVYMCAYVYVY